MMAQSEDEEELSRAVNELYSNITVLPDKKQAWGDLHRLIYDKNELVRLEAGYALSGVFSHIPDKEQAWDDLIWLTANDVNINVGWYMSDVLGSVFPYVPNKKQAQDDLHRLTQAQSEYDEDARLAAGCALGSVFPHVPDKKQAWKDMIHLTSDESSDVRAFANYSLGRASIFKATESPTDDNFRNELENAIEFFEKSAKEEGFFIVFSNPASFCLPFYRSFYAITFKKEKVEDEVQKYFAEAKSAVKGSNSKEKLLEVVENLVNALKEAQNAKNLDDRTSNLNSHRQYIERAAELLRFTEEKAPGATKLIRKGLPIIDQKIKELLGEIEEKARKFCKDSRETPFEKISRNAYEHVKGLGETENPIKAEISLNGLIPLLRSMCRILPDKSRGVICSQLDEMEESKLSDKARIIGGALSSIQPQIINLQEKLADREKWIEYFKNLVIQRLDNINYDVFQLKIRSGEIVPTLHEIQHELKKLIIIKTDLDNIGLDIKDFGNLQRYDIQKLNDGMTLLCRKIETEIIPKLPKASDTHRIIEIQKKIQDLKQSKEEIWFNHVAGLSSIVSLILTIL